MSNGKIEKKMDSPFSIVFGVLVSLVLNDFIKAASSRIFMHDSIDSIEMIIANTLIVLLSGFWFFYIIYGTLTWLLFTEYNPRKAGIPPSLFKMLCLRFLEFIPFIWLYDIIFIINPDSKKLNGELLFNIDDINLLSSRLSLDIGIVLLLWLVWRLTFTMWLRRELRIKLGKLNLSFRKNSMRRKSQRRSSANWLILLFAMFFMIFYLYQGSIWLLLGLSIVYFVLDINLIHKNFYHQIDVFLKKMIAI